MKFQLVHTSPFTGHGLFSFHCIRSITGLKFYADTKFHLRKTLQKATNTYFRVFLNEKKRNCTICRDIYTPIFSYRLSWYCRRFPGLKPTQLHGGSRMVGTLSLKNSIVDLEKEQVHCSGYSTFCFVPSYLSIPIHWQSKVVDLVNTSFSSFRYTCNILVLNITEILLAGLKQ